MDQRTLDRILKEGPAKAVDRLFTENHKLLARVAELRQRTDPLLSEQAVLGNLSMPCIAENAEPLQVGALLTLVAMFDRKLDRALFIEAAENVTHLFGLLGRLSIAESVKHMMENKVFDQEKIETAAKELHVFAEAERHKIVKQMELVAKCPTSEDTLQ